VKSKNRPSPLCMIVWLSWCNIWDVGMGLGLAKVGPSYGGPSPCLLLLWNCISGLADFC